MRCGHDDCFSCPYPDCILDGVNVADKKPKRKPSSRSGYYRKWYEAHRTERQEYSKQYYRDNIKEGRKKRKQYYKDHQEKMQYQSRENYYKRKLKNAMSILQESGGEQCEAEPRGEL